MERTDEDTRAYRVLINHEEQYSIWLADLSIPNGWTDTGTSGSKSACLLYISKVWTDMRPKSLRETMSGVIAAASSPDNQQ